MQLVEASWLEGQLASTVPDLVLVDPRLRVRYTSGHLEKAVHVPMRKIFGETGSLLPDEHLAAWLGSLGIGTDRPAVLYDQHGGGGAQAGAMMAWLLQYLGHPDVRFLRIPFEQWQAEGREIFYRPVVAEPSTFVAQPRLELRSQWNDVEALDRGLDILDTRSEAEFAGAEVAAPDDLPGHIPQAKNIPWLKFVSGSGSLFRAPEELRALLERAGLSGRRMVTYCRSGPRAAVAFIALQQAGYEVSLYDGSLADWSRRGRPLAV